DKSMLYVVVALCPAALWGVVMFGVRAAVVLAVSIGAALLTEFLLNKISGEHTLLDFSALITGLLVGMNMPSSIPLYIPVLGSAFAIGVVKWTFGGLGCNWANPAIAGRVFVFFSFSSAMSSFPLPWVLKRTPELVASATPLSTIKMEMGSGLKGAEILANAGRPVSAFAEKFSNPYLVDAFFGFQSGTNGEISALLLILGGPFLIWKKGITWRIPCCYIGSFALLSWVFGGCANGLGLFHGEILLPVLSGGLLLGAIFMATDWVTTPTTPNGEIVFAVGCGFFTFLIRYFGSLAEGVSLAILLMNMVSPTIDRYVTVKKFGYVKPVKVKKEAK
ncbi:MAG: RnfABCDGE type electron transport complex subunit D, partial [Spirochaetales bacterium]|nr:RnfABCDGE type electron transport complex subunit D [Candidatus Physcosoma equi]